MDSDLPLIQIDKRGRASLRKLGAAPGRYLAEVQSDGAVVLHPATVMTRSQARLLARPDILAAIDEAEANPSLLVRRPRPQRKPAL